MPCHHGITILKNRNKESGEKQMPEAEDLTWYWAGFHLCKKQMIFFGTCHLALFSLRQCLEQPHPERRHQKINTNFLIFMSWKTNRQANFLLCKSGDSETIILKLNASILICSVQLTLEYFHLSVNIVKDYTVERNVQNTPMTISACVYIEITQETSYIIFKRCACCPWMVFCSEASCSWNWVGRESSITCFVALCCHAFWKVPYLSPVSF